LVILPHPRRGRACPTPDRVRSVQPGDGKPSPAFPLVTTRVGQALPLQRAGSKTNERTGNVDENKGQPTSADSRLRDREHGAEFDVSSLNIKTRSQSPLPGERVACGGAFISRRRPGEGWVPVHTDIHPMILLIPAGILPRLSLPPQSRRI
jgi:hypothetical protein